MPDVTHASLAQRARRPLWFAAGVLAVLTGLIGIVLPLLPTVPFMLLAAMCFSRSCERCERWLLAHPRFGPALREWRAHRAMPLRAKQLAVAMMAVSSVGAAWLLPSPWRWLPGLCCTAVAVWMWRLPTSAPASAPPRP
jgi:uncharacterized protein